MLKTSKLITANIWFEMDFLKFRRTRLLKAMMKHRLQDFGVDSGLKPLVAIVNHGRWLVICPDCGGAEYAWEEKYMMCISCFNEGVGHKFRPAIFPVQREQIEELLILRPLSNRNWSLGETVADLRKENEEHSDKLIARPSEKLEPFEVATINNTKKKGGKGYVLDNSSSS